MCEFRTVLQPEIKTNYTYNSSGSTHTYMHMDSVHWTRILLTHTERNLFSRSLTIRFYCHIAIYMTNICTQQISMNPTNIINHNHRISVLKCKFICIYETEDNKTCMSMLWCGTKRNVYANV